jgi:hypothetical protein
MSDAGQNLDPLRRLSQAIRDVKNATADRDDVVVELREASRMRLELLAQELQPVFAEVPPDDEQFDLAISSGLQPRLWIDVTAHVAMGRDRRSYRFVRDTRAGRVVLADTPDIRKVADQVTRYIAERMIEKQRMLEGSVAPAPGRQPAPAAGPAALRDAAPPAAAALPAVPPTLHAPAEAAPAQPAQREYRDWGAVVVSLLLVLIGAVASLAGLMVWQLMRLAPIG